MPRRTIDATLERRRLVESLHVRGVSPPAIAKELHADVRTVRRDIAYLQADWAASTEAQAERHRLLMGARRVETESWMMYQALNKADAANRLGALGKVLASQEAQARLLGQIEAVDLAADVAVLTEQVAGLLAERPHGRRTETAA